MNHRNFNEALKLSGHLEDRLKARINMALMKKGAKRSISSIA